MTEWVVAVGSTRAPKIRAVETALARLRDRFPSFLGGAVRVEARTVPSGAPSTPRTTAEMMTVARRRAENVLAAVAAEASQRVLGVGLEGGVRVETDGASRASHTFLEAWSFVTDGTRGSFGSSGAIPLPRGLAIPVASGEDLGSAADRWFGRSGVAGREGTFGVLTGGLVSREEAFVRSLIHALAPFYNAAVYDAGDRARPAPQTAAEPETEP